MSRLARRVCASVLPLLIATTAPAITAAPDQTPSPRPIRIVLVGDSTVTDRSGWGYGFKLFAGDGIECVNLAAGGRSSKSYIDEGKWKEALARKGDYYLIQFGHNDEPGKGPDRETDPKTTYREYMSRYVDDVRRIGAQPVLVTSLTRRHFEGRAIVSTLTPYVEAVKALAAEKNVLLIDLHARSIEQAETMGDEAWAPYSSRLATGGVDRTHLNSKGSTLVARLVVSELRRLVPALAPHLNSEPQSGVVVARRDANAVVAADGSGQYTTVQEAINAAPQNTTLDRPWIIYIKAGSYREVVYVQREKRFVKLVGEDPARTTITYNLHANMVGSDGKPIGTFRTPTVQIDADDFSAENLTFENTAGPVGQALAVRVDGDRVVFRNCRFLGWQDTVFLNRGRHYFIDSYIAGHVDFIFGGATAYFDRCDIHVLRNGYITAASTPVEQKHGLVFVRSRITGAADARTYLGRPWRDHAQVTFLDTQMSDVVRPEGWHNWDKPEREKTSRYYEIRSTGPGATAARRVPWVKTMTAEEVTAISTTSVLAGSDAWDPDRLPAYPSESQAVNAAGARQVPGASAYGRKNDPPALASRLRPRLRNGYGEVSPER